MGCFIHVWKCCTKFLLRLILENPRNFEVKEKRNDEERMKRKGKKENKERRKDMNKEGIDETREGRSRRTDIRRLEKGRRKKH
jgi:hypothetical protein